MARIVFHVDLDSFYTAVEMREHPELRGKPVIVGADPNEGKGRGVVMASSYEARALGIKAGMPISLAWRKLPDAVYKRPNYDLYGTVSENVMNILREYAGKFEQASIDEAYLDVTAKTDWDHVREYAVAVKKAVREREGLTCSIGVAPNKSCAKIAAAQRKPDGLMVVWPQDVSRFLAPLSVNAISGVGEKTERVLADLGIRTVGELAAYPGTELTKVLGRNAVWLWGIARGLEELPVEERPDAKSISVERTFERDVDAWDAILETLDSVADNVHLRVRNANVTFRTVSIKIRFEGFQTHTRDRTLPTWTDDRDVLMNMSRELIAEFRDRGRPVRMIGVRVANLWRPKGKQASLPA
ncbi:MAG: DNA polymerase IV [Euryarchaeota archaeon]|nr:DNA polymerase IV [Euryarchaeota archaeon]